MRRGRRTSMVGACAGALAVGLVSAVTAGAFTGRSAHDMVDAVDGTGLAANTTVIGGNASGATLSQPWTGARGTARLRVRSNQWNYAVAFEMPAP